MPALRAWAAAVGVASLAAGGCVVSVDSQGHTAREERRFDVVGVPDVHLTTFDGSVEVRSWDRDEVLVEVEKRGPTSEAVASIEVVAEQAGSRIQLEVRRPAGGTRVLGFGLHASRSARLIATVPRRSNVVARSGDGSIRIARVEGRLELRTSDGSIRGSELTGDLVVHTSDGSVSLQEVAGALDLTTGDGGINVAGLFERLNARTEDGSVTIRAEPGSEMTADWSIATGDGSVLLYLPRDFRAQLDAHTGDGRISSDLDVTFTVTGTIERNTLRGSLGDGGNVLRVRTGDGTIRLRMS